MIVVSEYRRSDHIKANISFNFTADELQDNQLLVLVKSRDLVSVIYDMDQYLHHRIKYEDLPVDKLNLLQEVRDELYRNLSDLNLQWARS